MSADFTPSFGVYKETGSFKFWCQKVLPLVYDDSLSYYETLCKVVKYLNDVIANVDVLHDDVDALRSAYIQLQSYVNSYFDNLDVQNEINQKLDDMADDGSLSALLSPIVATQIGGVVGEQIDAVVGEQIDASVGRQIDESVASQIGTPTANATTAWLNEHVNPVGSAVVVDDTLTIEGAAADAKVCGDEFGRLNSALTDVEDELTYTENETVRLDTRTDNTNGYIDNSDSGTVVSHVNFITSNYYSVLPDDEVDYTNLKTVGANVYPIIACYDANDNYVKSKSLMVPNASVSYSGTFTVPSGIYKLRFVFFVNTIVTMSYNVRSSMIDHIEGEISDLNDKIDDNLGTYTKTVSNFSDFTFTNGVVIKNDGSTESRADAKTSDYFDASDIVYIKYNVYAITNYNAIIACYDKNKIYMSDASVKSTYEGPSGRYELFDGTFTVPNGVAFVRICWYDRSSEESEEVKTYITLAQDYANTRAQLPTQWQGKSWYGFGTSITDTDAGTGKYPPYLEQLSGLVFHNYGVAGGSIGSGGIHGGSSQILNKITSTDLSDADLITIEGFVNDFANAVSLGQLGDEVNTTLYGAITLAVKYCLQNSNAVVCLITESTGRQYDNQGTMADYRRTKLNSLNKTQNDYNNVIRDVGKFLGVHVIDAGGESQVNEDRPDYLADWIHQSELGGEQYARTIWGHLKNIPCCVVDEE